MVDGLAKLFSAFFFGLRDLVNGITNTIWGLVVIFWALYLLSHRVDPSVAYYFAGVGSTLLGISSQQGHTNTITNSKVNMAADPANIVEGKIDAKS